MQLPVVGWHSSHDILSAERPSAAHRTVLDPYFRIVGSELDSHIGILDEERRMRLDALVHDNALVDDAVLHGESRADHLAACAIVVEFAIRQRQYSHFQRIEFAVSNLRIVAQSKTKVRIEVIEVDVSCLYTVHHVLFLLTEAAVHKQAQSLVRQDPDTNVHQEEMLLHQLSESLDRRFLQHVVELVGVVAT